MARIAALALIFVLLVPAPAQADNSETENELLSEEVIRTLLSMHYAREYPVVTPLNLLVFGDVNGDGRNDAVLTYLRTNDVGHHYEYVQRIVVFIYDYDERKLMIRYDSEIDSSQSRMLQLIAIEDGFVKFNSFPCSLTEIGECSDSDVTETQFHWSAGELVEL